MKYNTNMICKKVGLIHLLLILFINNSGQLYSLEIPFQENPQLKEMGLLEEPLATDDLLELLLIVSGTNEQNIPIYTEKLEKLISGLPVFLTGEGKNEKKPIGESVLIYLHEKALTNYRLSQTRIDVLMDTGNYNCVSSAVLYLLLNRSINLETYGIHTVDHAFCAVKPSDSTAAIDVETTNIWGYNPGEKKEFESDFSRITGYAYVPPGDYSNRTQLGDKDMAGLILQNRIVELQKRNRYKEALSLAADRLVLTGSEQAEKDYFDSVQNLAAWHNSRNQYKEGIEIINKAETGSLEVPSFLKETRYQMVYNLCGSILNRGNTELAEEVLSEYQTLLPLNLLKELTSLIEEKRLDKLIKTSYSEGTIKDIENSLDKGLITQKRAMEMMVYLLAKEAERISLIEGYLKGLLFLRDKGSQSNMGNDYSRLVSVYEQNFAVSIHNEVIPLVNDNEIEKALNLIREGLFHTPESEILQNDLIKLESLK